MMGNREGMKKASTLRASDQDLEQLASLFRVLSDKSRLSILLSLAKSEKHVAELCDELELPQATLSHHLSLLRMNNIVVQRREGKLVYYGIEGRLDVAADSLTIPVQNLYIQLGLK